MRSLLLGEASPGRYALIGVSGVALDTITFVLLTRAGLFPLLATMLSTSAGILNNYLLNAHFNFRHAPNMVHLRRFFTVGMLGLAVSAASLEALLLVGTPTLTAKLISIPVVVACQFFANKYWTFRDV